MAKGQGNKFKRNGNNIDRPNGKIKKVKVTNFEPTNAITPDPAPLTNPAEASSSNPARNRNEGASHNKEKKVEKQARLSGFIFMCSPITKSECYQYRVFGLPVGKLDVVEKIKNGTKLFLFDFELKLLYGIYEATSAGQLNLEPAAFRGKFPAQVKFRIFKECLPLPESSLRHVIKENYKGLKFNQELNAKQVRSLLSTFRPLAASSYQLVPPALPSVSLSRAMPHSETEDQFKLTSRLVAAEDPYLAGMRYGHAPPLPEPQTIPKMHFLQHGYHETAAYTDHVQPNLDRQGLSLTSKYYVADAQHPYFTETLSHRVHDPYSRYRTIPETSRHIQLGGISHDQVTSLEREHLPLPLQRQVLSQVSDPALYVSAAMPPRVVAPGRLQWNASISSNLEREHLPLPLQRQVLSQVSDPALYVSAAMQPRVVAPGRLQGNASISSNLEREHLPLHLQRQVLSQVSDPALYVSAAMQPRVVAPGRLQGNASISSKYSYSGLTWMNR